MDLLLRLVLYLFLFVVSLAGLIASAPLAKRRMAWLQVVACLATGTVGGAALGAMVGMLLPLAHGSVAGAVGTGVAGFFGGLIVALRRILAGDETKATPPSLVTVVGIVAGSLIGALAGLLAAAIWPVLEPAFMFGFVGALFGTLAGGLIGLTYEKPLAGAGILGFIAVSVGLGMAMAWQEGWEAADSGGETAEEAVGSAPQPTIWDQMYDRDGLLDALTSDKPGAPIQAVATLWMLVDGGPKFRRDGDDAGATLRETFAMQRPYAGVWEAQIDRAGETLVLQFNFAEGGKACTLTVSRNTEEPLIDTGTLEIDGAEVTLRSEAGVMTMDFADFEHR